MNIESDFDFARALKPTSNISTLCGFMIVGAIIIVVYLMWFKKEGLDVTKLLVTQQRGMGGHNPQVEHALGILTETRLRSVR